MTHQSQTNPMKSLQMPGLQMPGLIAPPGAGLLRKSMMALLAGMVIMTFSLLQALPAMALAYHHPPGSNIVAIMSTVAAMPNKAKALAKDTEGKLESAYGGLTGDVGSQIKGNAKQAQSSAMRAGEEIKKGAKSVAKKIGDATD